VQVYILLSAVTDETVRQLTDAGATIEIRDAASARVAGARFRFARLSWSLSLRASTRFVCRRTHAGARAVTTEGDAILRPTRCDSSLARRNRRARRGHLGRLKGVFATGCTTSCAGVDAADRHGDLPSASASQTERVLTSSSGGIIGRSFSSQRRPRGLPPAYARGSSPAPRRHGAPRGVHDLAPAKFRSPQRHDLALNQAVIFSRSNDVVLDSIGFFGEPYDGTSAVS